MKRDVKNHIVWIALGVIATVHLALAVPPPAGIAPVGPGGFGIDGDLMANKPVANVSDWIANTNTAPGSGVGVLRPDGTPIDPTHTFHFKDPYNDSANDLIFSGGAKWTDDPNTWTWTPGKPSSKSDINNVLLHLTTDTNGHVWAILAADHFSTSGDTYIDFELLQNLLTRNANGTFSSAGPQGGRTTNDVLLSLAFTGGGKVADFFVWSWMTNGLGGYAYTDITALLPAGHVFVALNTNAIPVPYGAFGSTNYQPNAFAEAAVDLTGLLGNFNQCESFGFKTIMIKTKASASYSAGIEDFIDPIQYNLRIGPNANAGPDQVLCSEGAETAFTLAGIADSGAQPLGSTNWTVVSGDASIDDPGALTTTARVRSASATLRLTVAQVNGCSKSDDIVLTVQPPLDCAITGPNVLCPRATNSFFAPVGMNSYAWQVSGNGAIAGPANGQTVKVVGGTNCGQPFTLALSVQSNACSAGSVTDVLVTDSTGPTLVVPPDRVLDCQASTATNATGVATATDTCSRVTLTFSDAVTPGCGITKTISRTWLATDECGNAISGVQTIVVQDLTPPVLVCPADRTVECTADTSPAGTGMATATDACGSAQVSFSDSVTPGCGATKVIARLWTAVDLCGNAASRTQTITVRDTTPPVLVVPSNLTLEAPADTTTNATGTATAADACGNATVSFSDSVTNGCGSAKTIARRWTAVDDCGNSTNRVQLITVRDTTAPVITCPPALTLEYPAATTTNVTGVATATDAGSTPVITYTDSTTNGCGVSKVINRRWTATDACGNSASCIQVITVQDSTPPVLTLPASLTLECTQPTSTNYTGVATATDPSGKPAITYTDSVTNGCGATMTIARRWTATDACGNSSSDIQMIIVRDTTAPVITCPANLTLEAPGVTTTNVTGVATATDTCSSATVSYSDSVVTNCGSAVVISRTWRATDACGNSSTCVQTITVRDTKAPVITVPPALTLECSQPTTTNVTGVATATDAGSTPIITYTDFVTNSCGGARTITRRWTATDACGNAASGTQLITVRDTTAPTLTLPANMVVEAPGDTRTNATGVATALDACGSAAVTYSDVVSNTCGISKVIYRRWTAADECGNSASGTQVITVRDTTPPALVLPASLTLECTQPTSTNFTGVATATDASGTAVIAYTDAVTNGCGATMTIGRRWTATDACGNVASGTQIIAVRDTTPPVISCPPALTFEAPAVTTTNVTGVATATDTCSSATVTYSDSVVTNCGSAITISRTWRATDACGNSSTCVQTITVRDTIAPVITVPPALTIECSQPTTTNATGVATATDAGSKPVITYTDFVTNSCGAARIITRRWTATDACGNASSGTQVITVRDTTAPTLTVPANVVLQAPGDTRTNVTGTAIAVDACGPAALSYSDVVTNGCGSTRTVWRQWTATDPCGNTSSGLQLITVVDTQKPSVTSPTVTVQCAGDVPPPYAKLADFLAAGGAATDNSTNALGFALLSDSGLVGKCPGTVTRVYRVTDDCGNYTDTTQTITVADTIPPVIVCPPGATVACSDPLDPAITGRATATDNCSTNVTISYSDTPIVGSSYNINWYASDPDVNTGPYAPTYLKLGPASLAPPTGGRAADPLRNAVAYGPTAGQLDALTSMGGAPMTLGQIVPFQAVIDVSGAPDQEHGTIEFTTTWSTYTTSNDRFGYDTNYMVYAAFVDTADPGSVDPNYNARVDSFSSKLINAGTINEQIQGTFRVSGLDPGDRIVVEVWVVLMSTQPDHVGGTIAANLVSAQKVTTPPQPISTGGKTISIGNLNKMGPLPPPQPQPPLPPQPPQPAVLPPAVTGLIDRTWTATDDCGNRSTCVQRLTIVSSPPGLIMPANLTLEYPAATGTNVTGVALAPTGCGAVTVTYSDTVSNGCGNTAVISRLWTATDAWGVSTNAVQTISVVDTTAPTLTVPADVTLEAPADSGTNVTGVATAVDAGGPVAISYSDMVSNCCGISIVISRQWTATDACGNSTNAVQTISVLDTTPPVLSLPANKTLASGQPVVFDTPTATDASGTCTVQIASTTTNLLGGGSYTVTRTWYATDACGNRSQSLSQTITVAAPVVPPLDRLTIAVGPGGVLLRWPTNAADYRLEAAAAANAQRWTPVPVTPSLTNGEYRVLLPLSAPSQFFRLSDAAPALELSVGGNQLHLSWPTAPSGFQLESSDTMQPGTWAPVLITPVSSNAYNHVDVPLQPATRVTLFRLKK
jgi:hypothetical protein